MISREERKKLWELYPEVRALFEEFNYTLLEDDAAWKRVVDKCHEIRKKYPEGKLIEIALSDAAYELEKIAKKRGRRYE